MTRYQTFNRDTFEPKTVIANSRGRRFDYTWAMAEADQRRGKTRPWMTLTTDLNRALGY